MCSLLCIPFWSCSSIETPEELATDATTQTVKNRTVDEAIQIANRWADTLFPTTSRSSRTTSPNNVKRIVGHNSRSGEALLYVVNYDNNEGFVVVPVPDIEQDIIAAVPEGNYDPILAEEVKPFKLYMENATQYVENKAAEQASSRVSIPTVHHSDTIYSNEPIVKMGEFSWGQSSMCAAYTSNNYAGSGPLTLAMAMVYMKQKAIATGGRPSQSINYTFALRDRNSEVLDWSELYRHKRYSQSDDYGNRITTICNCIYKDATHLTMGRICAQFGQEMGANYLYHPDSKMPWKTTIVDSLYRPVVAKYLSEFTVGQVEAYTNETTLNWHKGTGIILMICRNKVGEKDYHYWISDGYLRGKIYDYYIHNNYPYTIIRNIAMDSFKWGYNGLYDGFYLTEALYIPDGCFEQPTFIGIK